MKKTKHPLALACRSALASLAGVASVSMLPVADVLAQGGQLEEVVVTSTYREQSLQDIPIAVTALSGDLMAKEDIFDLTGISINTPNFSFTEFAPGQTIPVMRGIGSADDGAGLDNSIAIFLDGVYIGRGAGNNFEMFDLERVEVVRGPQGTLFGRNAIGGAVLVKTSKPSEEFEGKVALTAGNYGTFRAQGFVSGPLSESVRGKLVASTRQHDGYVDNVVLGTELQDEDNVSVRGQLLWVGDSSEWLLSADYAEDDRADMGRTPIVDKAPLQAIMAQNGLPGGARANPRKNASPYDGYSQREMGGVSLTGDLQFEYGSLTSVTAFRSVDTSWQMTSIGAGVGGLGLPFDEVVDDIEESVETFSQEFRWTSNIEGPLSYTAGVFFFYEDTDRTEVFRTTVAGDYDDPTAPFRITNVGSQAILGNDYAQTANETTSFAVFAQGDYALTDKLTVTAGIRFTRDEKDYTATSVNCGMVAAGDPSLAGTKFENWAGCGGVGASGLRIIAETFEVTPSDSWSDVSPKLSVQYAMTDTTMVYASWAKGFKSGGFAGSQGVEAVASEPVDQETAYNYELGIKSDITDSLRVNATAFYMDYEDLQVVRFGPVPGSEFGTFVTTNLGSADIKGFELESTLYVTDSFKLEGFLAYLDSEGKDLIINGGDYSGQQLVGAPELSYALRASYDQSMSFGDISASVTFSHEDEALRDYVDDRIKVDERDLVDARFAWTSTDGAIELALWGKNLTEEDYISHMYVIGPGGIGVWGAPRTYGVTGTFSF
jgi:iron complex outermembrane recepter protein